MTCGNCEDCGLDESKEQPKEVFYELHLTVKNGRVEDFKKACEELSLKPILLDLQLQDGGIVKDLMTSSQEIGTYREVVFKMLGTVAALKRMGFVVIRQKIETVPWHPLAPTKSNGRVMGHGQYLESHLGLLMKDISPEGIAKKHSMHLSKNAFKETAEGTLVMATMRWYRGTIEDFRAALDLAAQDFKAAGFSVEKTIVEFAIYDSKEKHDAVWMAA